MQSFTPRNDSFSIKESKILDDEIAKLIQLGAISICNHVRGQFLSKIFTVTKPNGSYRFILNLKQLNKFIIVDHFKMEDYRTAANLVTKDSYMAKIDLQDAYFSIPISEESKKYLRFMFKGQLFEFNVLCFGLCSSPYVFTKVLKPAVALLRLHGFHSVQYLDDFLCIGDDYSECKINVEKTSNLLQNLGFIINKEKSNFIPSRECSFLGFIFDSNEEVLKIDNDKRKNIDNLINSLLQEKSYTIRHLAKVLGSLTSVCPAISYGWLYTKKLERHRYLSLKKHNDDYEYKIRTPSWCIPDLKWWKSNIYSSVGNIRKYKYSLHIYSDASLTGYGASCNQEVTHGFWTTEEQQLHINILELKAAFQGLKTFAENSSSTEILLRIDNTTAISYINRMGGVMYPQLHSVAEEIWKWCEIRKIWLYASYISSKDNYVADFESRRLKTEIEWSLEGNAFKEITIKLGIPNMDLFASRHNFKCQRYVSWHADPEAYAIDAFTIDWSAFYFYAFPPFSLVLRTLRKIKIDKAEGIVVIPYWETQPFFPLFMSMLVSKIIIFSPRDTLLCSDAGDLHPLRSTLQLAAGILSGKHS